MLTTPPFHTILVFHDANNACLCSFSCTTGLARRRTHVPQRTRAYTGTTTDSGTGCLFKPEACQVSFLDGLQLFPSDLCSWKPAWSCYWPSSIWLFFGFPLPAYICCWFMLLNNGGYCTFTASAATSVSSARTPLCSYMTLGAEHLVPRGYNWSLTWQLFSFTSWLCTHQLHLHEGKVSHYTQVICCFLA